MNVIKSCTYNILTEWIFDIFDLIINFLLKNVLLKFERMLFKLCIFNYLKCVLNFF